MHNHRHGRAISGTQQPTLHSFSFHRWLKYGASTGAIIACAVAGPALAQSNDKAQSNAGSVTLPTISVEGAPESGYKVDRSASPKFTAPLVDTPKSVTVITKELIEERNATGLQGVLRTMPGITLGAGEGGTPNADLPNIRGYAAEGNIYLDGLRDTGAQTRDVYNLEQVEVVKGPGSAYAGRGATGGSINLVTKKPFRQNAVSGTVSAGYPFSKRATADANYVVDDWGAVRLNAMVEDSEVSGRDEVKTNSIGFAPSMALDLGERTRVTLNLSYLRTDDIPDYGHPYDPVTGSPVDVDRDNFYGLLNRDFQETEGGSATLAVEHTLEDNLLLRNITRISRNEIDYIVTNPNDSRSDNIEEGSVWRSVKSRNSDTRTFLNQTDLSGEFKAFEVKHSFNAGIEFGYEASHNRNYSVNTGNSDCSAGGVGAAGGYNCVDLYAPNPGDPWSGSIVPSATATKTLVQSQAVYAFDTIELTPKWLLNVGLRFDNYLTKNNSGQNNASFLNYQLGVVYKPMPNGSVYAAFGTSTDPSGATAGEGRDNLGSGDADLDPEESRSFEVGTKWNLLNNRLAATGAVFRTEKTNARYATEPGRGAAEALGGEQYVQGAEIGLSGRITDKWRVFSGYTFLKSKIVDDGPISTNEGNRLPNVPMHSLSVWTTYDVVPKCNVGLGVTYMSQRYGSLDNTKRVPSFWRLDASVTYAVTDDVTLRLNANNLLDTAYYDKPFLTHFATVAPGRSFVLTTDFKF
ncbi:MAG: TonB-dependent siderophore receptor [Rhodospirillales bacterium]